LEVAIVALSFGLHTPPAILGPLLLSGETVYFGRGCLGTVVEFCFKSSLVVLGMEGFITNGSFITPCIDFIADLSEIEGHWKDRVRMSRDAANAVIKQWNEQSGFEFVEFEVAIQQRG
jgi:hypothetical protein